MKIAIIALLLSALCIQTCLAQNPTYILRAMNITRSAPNEYTFEIRMQHTNSSVYFEYAGGQYFFDFNAAIANGGTLTYRYALDSSDLPSYMRPRNPQVSGSQLRLAVNTFPGIGNGFVGMSTTSPGTKIAKMSLKTSASAFANVDLNLIWRNGPVGPFTKLFAYVANVNTDISSYSTHFMDTTIFVYPGNLDVKVAPEGLVSNGTLKISDSVDIYIKSIASPYQTIYSQRVLLDASTLKARISCLFPSGTYYIVVKHKNSIETWSKTGGEQFGGGDLLYDFTTSASQAFGNNMVLKDGLYCLYSGNVNGDDVIDAEDLLAVDNAVFSYAGGNSLANLNGDQIVDIEDMAICDNNARELRVVQRPGMAGGISNISFSTP